jgi:hypothetical protein
VAACREEAEARTAENLHNLRDMILELESDWVAVEILLKTIKIGTDFGIGLCSCKLLPESSDVGEGRSASWPPSCSRQRTSCAENCPGLSEAGAIQGKQCSGK